jgi:hypothetical protein
MVFFDDLPLVRRDERAVRSDLAGRRRFFGVRGIVQTRGGFLGGRSGGWSGSRSESGCAGFCTVRVVPTAAAQVASRDGSAQFAGERGL